MSTRDSGHARLSPPTIAHIAGLQTIVAPARQLTKRWSYSCTATACGPRIWPPLAGRWEFRLYTCFPRRPEAATPGGYRVVVNSNGPSSAGAARSALVTSPSRSPRGLVAARRRLERFVERRRSASQPLRLSSVASLRRDAACDWTLHHPATAHGLLDCCPRRD